MKILILGGSQFFGKRLVQNLLDEHVVTVFTRGRTTPPKSAKHFRGDRQNADDLKKVLKNITFDIIYDQIGFNAQDAQNLLKALKHPPKKIIFTSSASVYMEKGGENLKEEDIPTKDFEIDFQANLEYHRGKQMAESYYLKNSPCPVICPRFPFVMGEDDYTRRLHWHVERIQKSEETLKLLFRLCMQKMRPIFLAGLKMLILTVHSTPSALLLNFKNLWKFSQKKLKSPINSLQKKIVRTTLPMEFQTQ